MVRNSQSTHLHVVSMYGPPGVGKSTQGQLLIDRKGFSVVSTGDILKNCTPGFTGNTVEAMRHRDTYAHRLFPYLSNYTSGGYVPDDVMFPVLTEEVMLHYLNGRTRILLPGSIKTRIQAEALDKFLIDLDGHIPSDFHFVNYVAPTEIAVERLIRRDSDEVRPDSNIPESRVQAFLAKAFDLIDYYRQQNRVLEINAVEDIETVYERTIEAIGLKDEQNEAQIETDNFRGIENE